MLFTPTSAAGLSRSHIVPASTALWLFFLGSVAPASGGFLVTKPCTWLADTDYRGTNNTGWTGGNCTSKECCCDQLLCRGGVAPRSYHLLP